ncbi:MAG TPA: hypothetical protein PLS92_09995 [Flavobacteriales bacterium]|nr:hypothetical protein [Flavobacteriales bacterium]HQY80171.1 hypothetical protein [Flavobacteriales bacterium]
MRSIIPLFTMLIASSLAAQTPEWGYGYLYPGGVLEGCYAMATNDNDRFVLVGGGNSGVDLDVAGSGTVAAGQNFIAVYDADATLLWQVPMATPGGAFVNAAMMDADGNVYVSGHFSGTVDFDPGTGNSATTAQSFDFYVQKLHADGSFAWVAHGGTENGARELAMGPNGHVYAAGWNEVAANVTLGNGSAVALPRGAFLTDIDAEGSLLNVISFSVPATDEYVQVRGLTVDGGGNIYLCGTFDGSMDMDPGPGAVVATAVMGYDGFIVKLDAGLVHQWYSRMGDTNMGQPGGWDAIQEVVVDANGDVYAGGYFTWTTDFDPDHAPGTFTLQADDNSQGQDGFIIRYSSAGAVQSVTHIGETDNGVDGVCQIDHMRLRNGVLVVGGFITYFSDVEPGPGVTLLGSSGPDEGIWYGTYTLGGQLLSAFALNDVPGGIEQMTDLGLLADGSMVTAGRFQKALDLDPAAGSLQIACDPNGGLYAFDIDLFVARYHWSGITGIVTQVPSLLTLFPNPARKTLNLSEPVNGVLIDGLGRTLQRLRRSSTIAVEGLAPGQYTIRTDDGVISRFIKE